MVHSKQTVGSGICNLHYNYLWDVVMKYEGRKKSVIKWGKEIIILSCSLLRSRSAGSHVMWQFVGHGHPDNNECTTSPNLWLQKISMLTPWPLEISKGGRIWAQRSEFCKESLILSQNFQWWEEGSLNLSWKNTNMNLFWNNTYIMLVDGLLINAIVIFFR